jgi:hypothetical protein
MKVKEQGLLLNLNMTTVAQDLICNLKQIKSNDIIHKAIDLS